MSQEIQFLHNRTIDINRWDEVIKNSVTSRVYAFSWYLTILHPDWHGVIIGDYEYVMPVIFSRKWGIRYMYQPIYAQQHGLFPEATREITASVFAFLEKEFKFIDISLNSSNLVDLPNWQVEARKNYILSLNKRYSETYKSYHTNCKSNLKKALQHNTVIPNLSLPDFMDFAKRNNRLEIVEKTFPFLNDILVQSMDRGSGMIYGAYSERGTLTGAAFFLNDGERYTYLCSFITEEGKKNRSMFSIFDTFIREHSEQNYWFDFEGSNIPGIAYFFSGFGAIQESYLHVRYNHLPYLLKLFKK